MTSAQLSAGSIVCEGLTKVYRDGTKAVDSLDLSVDPGQVLALVGPSGCGKTTLLRMIAGLEQITEGQLWIDGRLANSLRPRERDIAMVFQNYALYPHMNVFDNMAFGLRVRKMRRARYESRVRETADMLGLPALLDKRAAHLSGGQRQRVAMGRALVRSPRLLLMDEPLSNLDAQLRTRMRVEIARLQRRLGVTTVYVTHDQTEAMVLGDQIAVMKEGVVQQLGTADHIYRHPANIFVARFVGSPSMNVFMTTVTTTPVETVATYGDAVLRFPRRGSADRHELTNRPLYCGVRPEALHEVEVRDASVLRGVVELREELGSDVLAHVRIPNAPPVLGSYVDDPEDTSASAADGCVVARLSSGSTAREGTYVDLGVDPHGVSFFDPETGRPLAIL